MFRRGTRYPSAPSPGRPSTARISSLSSGETSSSASTERIQSLVACSRAKFFCAANPGHGRTQTRSVNSRAIWPVLSLDSASTTTRSEEHTSELQSLAYLVCRLLLEKKKLRLLRSLLHRVPSNEHG